jgi:hypothetical protein
VKRNGAANSQVPLFNSSTVHTDIVKHLIIIIIIWEHRLEIEFSDKVSTRRKPHSQSNTTCKAKSKGPWGPQSRGCGSDFEDHVNEKT